VTAGHVADYDDDDGDAAAVTAGSVADDDDDDDDDDAHDDEAAAADSASVTAIRGSYGYPKLHGSLFRRNISLDSFACLMHRQIKLIDLPGGGSLAMSTSSIN
jgi:hypothetical protein